MRQQSIILSQYIPLRPSLRHVPWTIRGTRRNVGLLFSPLPITTVPCYFTALDVIGRCMLMPAALNWDPATKSAVMERCSVELEAQRAKGAVQHCQRETQSYRQSGFEAHTRD